MYDEIDKYFLKYRKICKKINIKETELDEMKEKTIGSVGYNEKTNSSHAPIGLDQRLIQIENLEELIKKLYIKKDKIKSKYISDFEKLSKQEYEMILTSYYLDFVTIKRISIKMDKSVGHIKKLKREALNELLEKIIKK